MADPSIITALTTWKPALPLAVAYSGGADSTALLWACLQRWPGQVLAIHVNHGLQAAATDFERHCRQQCSAWGVPLAVAQVQAQNRPGQSPEDAARIARYKALEAFAQAGIDDIVIKTIFLAHHADDQVETVLLALSRGAGVAGLAGMRPAWQHAGMAWARPYLVLSAQQIRADLAALGIAWVQDPSNAHACFTRNRIRAQVAPGLAQAFPQFATTLARSAAHAAQASLLLDDLALMDMAAVGQPPVIKVLQKLSSARQANVLRYWLRSTYGQTPTAAQLRELCRQVLACSTRGHRIHLKVGHGRVERQGAVIDWYNPSVLV